MEWKLRNVVPSSMYVMISYTGKKEESFELFICFTNVPKVRELLVKTLPVTRTYDVPLFIPF